MKKISLLTFEYIYKGSLRTIYWYWLVYLYIKRVNEYVNSLFTVLGLVKYCLICSQNGAFLVRKSKTDSSEKPKQNLKREKEEKEWLGAGEGKFTIPTQCVH